jgi:hypothetical protein
MGRQGAVTASAPGIKPLGRGVLWLLIATAVVHTNTDPDLWGNLKFGLDLLGSHRVSTIDVYSFTQDQPWINHEWLAQVMMAASYRLAGTVGLVALKSLIVGATLWLIAGAFADAAPFVAEAAAIFVLWAALPVTLTFRAQLWTFLGLALLYRVLYGPSARARYCVPLMFIVWVNSHIGWVIGLGLVFLWAASVVVSGNHADRKSALIVAVLSLLATLVNPYGIQMWMFSVGVAHLSRNILEWQPLWTSPVVNWLPWIITLILALMFGRSQPRLTVEKILCIAGLAYASLRVLKFSNLFAELTILFLAPAICRRFGRRAALEQRLDPAVRLLNGAALAVVAAVVAVSSWPSIQCLRSASWRPDPRAARSLTEAGATGRVANYFDWGEYIAWELGPRLRVSFDPRFDLMYSAATIAEQQAVGSAAPAGTAFLERSRPEYVWFPQSRQALKAWLVPHGYRLDVETPESFVAVRADVATLQLSPPVAPGCFPNP